MTVAETAKNILFLRVGIDTGCGGTLGPIFVDGRFEYVPIPENPVKRSPRSVLYQELRARSGGTLDQFVPERYRKGAAHYDPEFETFTYGDPTTNKRRQLMRLTAGDYLVFYAGLRPRGFSGPALLYAVGYFVVQTVHEIAETTDWPPSAFASLTNNAHLRRVAYDPGLVIVSGCPEKSRLLQKAVPISDQAQTVLPEVTVVIGFDGSLKRAIGRWVPPGFITSTVDWLNGLA